MVIAEALEYRAVAGARLSDRDAATIGPALEALAREHDDQLDAETVVEQARSRQSPLHSYFEWDTRRAADLYRLEQARYLLRHIEVKIDTREGEGTWVRGFHAVYLHDASGAPQPERRYIPLAVVQADVDYLDQIISKAEREAQAWATRYRTYSELPQFHERLGRVYAAIQGDSDD